MEPTAVGEVNLEDRPLRALPAGGSWQVGASDTMLLVRLHGDPIGVVYFDTAPSALGHGLIAERVWQELSDDLDDRMSRGDLDVPGSSPEGHAPAVPARPDARVAVIIPTSGRGERLRRCLESLAVGLEDPGIEIIIVDNSPQTPGTAEVVRGARDRLPGLRYIAEPRPGSSVARNRGIAETDAELLAFTDDDVIIDRGWLPWLVAPFSDPDVSCVTGMVLPLELASAAQKQFELYAGFSKGVDRHVWTRTSSEGAERFLYPYWGGVFGSGNSMAFRRQALLDVGGFDPALGAGSVALAGADIAAMSATVLRGGRLVYEPRSLCWHEHRRDDQALARQVYNYGVGFTALLTKFLVRDPAFIGAVARGIPIVLRRRRDRAATSAEDLPQLPPALAALQRRGMIRGPLQYLKSVSWARRLRLAAVIAGR